MFREDMEHRGRRTRNIPRRELFRLANEPLTPVAVLGVSPFPIAPAEDRFVVGAAFCIPVLSAVQPGLSVAGPGRFGIWLLGRSRDGPTVH